MNHYPPGFYWRCNDGVWEVVEVVEGGDVYECGNEVALQRFGEEFPPGSLIPIMPPSVSK